jgi:hypothetical protein
VSTYGKSRHRWAVSFNQSDCDGRVACDHGAGVVLSRQPIDDEDERGALLARVARLVVRRGGKDVPRVRGRW